MRFEPHLGVEIIDVRTDRRSPFDMRELERLALFVRVAERPSIALVRRVPRQIDLGAVEIEPHQFAPPEDQRPGAQPRVDMLRGEQLPAAPGRIGYAQSVRDELDVDPVEIELEISRDLHVALNLLADDAFERMLQEAALGDVEHQPGKDDRQEKAEDDAQPHRHAPPAVAHRLIFSCDGWGRRPSPFHRRNVL